MRGFGIGFALLDLVLLGLGGEALPKHPDATYSVPATQADLVTPSS